MVIPGATVLSNGTITRDDLQGLGARLLAGFGASPAGARGRRVADSFDRPSPG